jgi:hypothetical protein
MNTALALLLCAAAIPVVAEDKTYFINNSSTAITLKVIKVPSGGPQNKFQGIQVSWMDDSAMQVKSMKDMPGSLSIGPGVGFCVEAEKPDVLAHGQFTILESLTNSNLGELIYDRPAVTLSTTRVPTGMLYGRLTAEPNKSTASMFQTVLPGVLITLMPARSSR